MIEIDKKIKDIDKFICESIEKSTDKGLLFQSLLGHLRTFVEHIVAKMAGYTIFGKKETGQIKGYIRSKLHPEYKFIKDFHDSLEETSSHFLQNKNASERIMYRYEEYLSRIKKNCQE